MSDSSRILFSAPNVDQLDTEEVIKSLRSGWIAPAGPQLHEFSNALQKQFNLPHIVLTNSGTSALHIALKLAGVQPGDHVIVGTFTFIAAANVVLYEKAVPIFIDSESDTWNINPNLLEEYLINSVDQPNFPRAVIVTHVYGIPAKIRRIKDVCDRFGVKLIEDAAEALGSRVDNEQLGCIGDYGVLSFNGNKIITTSGGGALICKNEQDQAKALNWITQSKSQSQQYQHSEIGYNYALSNILAGLGIGQLRKFQEFLSIKTKINDYYRAYLSDIEWLEIPFRVQGSNHWINPIIIKKSYKDVLTPEKVLSQLDQENIEARRFFMPLHCQPFLSHFEYYGQQVSENLYAQGICLPSGTGLLKKDLGRVVKVLQDLTI